MTAGSGITMAEHSEMRSRSSYMPTRPYTVIYAALFLSCMAGVALSSSGFLSGSASRWSSFTVACREGVVMPALFAGIASSVLCRQFDAANVLAGGVASRGSSRIWAYHLRRVVSLVLLGYVLGLIPLFIRLTATATWGSPDILALLDGCAVMCFLATFGMALGAFLTGKWNIVIIPALLAFSVFALLLANEFALVNTGRSSLLFSPIWNDDTPYLGDRVTAATHVLRIAFYAILIAMSAWLGARRLRADAAVTDLSTWLMAIPVVFSIALSITLSPPLVSPAPFTVDCERTPAGSMLCLHPADDVLRREIASSVDRTTGLLSHVPLSFIEYVPHGGNGPGVAFSVPLDDRNNIDRNQLISTLSSQIIMPDDMCSSSAQSTQNALNLVQEEVARRLGAGEAAPPVHDGDSRSSATTPGGGFSTMSDHEFTTWLDRNKKALRACAIQEDDLP